jgi:saccharopine dehydrogenase-like NADP-dependent oxidoreductase
MRALDAAARQSKVTLFNEIGLDPGLDHVSALSVIQDVKAKGGEVVGFESVCGGLPAPEAADNPLGYKFSWSPRGVLNAALNSARYLRSGRIVEVRGERRAAQQRR